MKLKWHGHAAFSITGADGSSIITDPYTPEGVGYAPITDTADLVITSSDDDDAHCRADLIQGSPATINALNIAKNGGRQAVNGVEISAIEAMEFKDHPEHAPGQNAMYRFTVDGIRIAHMGDVGNRLSDRQIAFFEDTDLLLALAGGYLTIEFPDLMEMIHAVRPKLVVPMHFRTLTYRPRNTHWIEAFLAHFHDKDVDFAFGSEVDLSTDDIPRETRVLVMDYAR